MASETSLTSSTRKSGGWKKPLVIVIILLLVTLGALVGYDVKAEPADDLTPGESLPNDETENGFHYLYSRWCLVPKLEDTDKERIDRIIKERASADGEFLERVRKGRENLAADLHASLEKPVWGMERIPPGGKTPMLTPLLYPVPYLLLEAHLARETGEVDRAVTLTRDISLLANRLTGSPSLMELLVGATLRNVAAEAGCRLLAQLPGDEKVLVALEEIWREDTLSPQVAREAILSELLSERAAITGRGPVYITYQKTLPAPARLLVKKNLTLNRLHELTRELLKSMEQTAPAMEESPGARLDALAKPRSFLSANVIGDRMIQEWVRTMKTIFLNHMVPRARFFQRAMRTRLALERWKNSHGGALPETLPALVPEFLPEVPADPWTGKPLLWDARAGVIYAAGADWVDDPPVFKDGYTSGEIKSPAVRVTAPPPPPSSEK